MLMVHVCYILNIEHRFFVTSADVFVFLIEPFVIANTLQAISQAEILTW